MSIPPPPPPPERSPGPPNWKLPAAQPLESASHDELEDLAQPPAGEIDVVNWRTGDLEQIATQFEPLREFVDWLMEVFTLKWSVVPGCWWRHPALVQELYGLYCFHAAAYPATDQGAGPLGFLERFNLAKDRMKNIAQETKCAPGAHKSAPARKGLTEVDADWYALAHGEASWLEVITVQEER